jgi:hypothetical protein
MSFQDNRNIPTAHPGHGQGPAGAGLSDLLTAVQHVASNIAALGQTLLAIKGTSTAPALTGAKLVKTGPGRIAAISVTVVGNAPPPAGMIIDANQLAATGPVIAIIPETVGYVDVSMPFSLGLLVVPAPGMTVTVSYS